MKTSLLAVRVQISANELSSVRKQCAGRLNLFPKSRRSVFCRRPEVPVFSSKFDRQFFFHWVRSSVHATAGGPITLLRKIWVRISTSCNESSVCWELPGLGSAKKWDTVRSKKKLLWQNPFDFIVFYCSGGDAIADIGRLLTTFVHICSGSRTKGESLFIGEKQYSLVSVTMPHCFNHIVRSSSAWG